MVVAAYIHDPCVNDTARRERHSAATGKPKVRRAHDRSEVAELLKRLTCWVVHTSYWAFFFHLSTGLERISARRAWIQRPTSDFVHREYCNPCGIGLYLAGRIADLR